MVFNGFPREFVDFLLSLNYNNTMEAMPSNKAEYKRLISEPLARLHGELAPVVSEISGSVITKPSKCISSMYSDMRFSRGNPLKGYMYLRFREPAEKDILGFYFDMGPEYYSYGIRIYKQTSAGMEKIREYALVNAASFTVELQKAAKLGMEIFGDSFARDRYPDVSDTTLKELLNKKSFYIGSKNEELTDAFDAGLLDKLVESYKSLGGLYLHLKNALYG